VHPVYLASAKERHNLDRNSKDVKPSTSLDFLKCVSTRNNGTKVRLSKSVLNGITAVIPEKINFPSCHWEDKLVEVTRDVVSPD